MKKLTVLTGAGISAESGLKTFRNSNGYWRHYRFEDVASPQAWIINPQDVLDFYNERRRQLAIVQPNSAHKSLVELEKHFDVRVITQNVDDLHERAGSNKVLHIHGELTKARSSIDPGLVCEIGFRDILLSDKASDGSKLRPHIVWFGEDVPLFPEAIKQTAQSDVLLIIGTSLAVYPAASLVQYCRKGIPVFYVDPNAQVQAGLSMEIIIATAVAGMKHLMPRLISMAC